MIVLFLKDGLGNQLFEYAFVRKLSQMYGDRIVINRLYFKRKNDRSCQLERLVLNRDVTYSGGIASFLQLLLLEFRLFLSLGLKFYLIHKDQEAFNRTFGGAEEIFRRCQRHGVYLSTSPYQYFDEFVSPGRRIKLVFGNFEHASFVKECGDVLRQEFRLKDPSGITGFLDGDKCNVSVHIRRGDYLNPQWKSLNVCGEDYFIRAMRHISGLHPDAVFNVFSNTEAELEWIKEHYHLEGNVRYVATGLDDVSDFFIMSACRHFVLSNSTFSWWASYLSEASDKIVVAPEIWSIGSPQSEGLYLPDFVRIKTNI